MSIRINTSSSSATVSMTQQTGGELVAPVLVWSEATSPTGFDVTATGGDGDPALHDIFYEWDFGQTGAYTTALNIPSSWNNKGRAHGYHVAHVIDTPRTITTTLTATDMSGTSAQATNDITVADPDTVYTGSRTILYDPAGVGDNATYPSSIVVTNLTDLKTQMEAQTQSFRVLIKRGITIVGLFSIGSTIGYNCMIGVYGSGARPIWKAPVLFGATVNHRLLSINSGAPQSIVIQDIHFEGRWDPTTETGDRRPDVFYNRNYDAVGGFILYHRCRISNWGDCDPTAPTNGDHCVALVDCEVESFGVYGVFCNRNNGANARFAIVGGYVRSDQSACNGKDNGDDGLSNQQGPTRIPELAKTYIGAADFFSVSGWTGDGQAGDYAAAQPCIRWGTAGIGGGRLVMDRVVCEGGWEIVNIKGENSGTTINPGNILVDRLITVGTAQTAAAMVNCSFGGSTLRNMDMVQPDVPKFGLGFTKFIGLSGNTSTAANDATRVRLYNTSAIAMSSEANLKDTPIEFNGSHSFSDIVIENNVLHVPNATTPDTADAPIDTTTAVPNFTPLFLGIRPSLTKPSLSLPSLVSGAGGTVTLPLPSRLDGTAMVAADFTASDNHTVVISGVFDAYYTQDDGEISIAVNGDDTVTITNNSGDDWPAADTVRISMFYAHTTDATYATGSVPLGYPQAGSPALDSATGNTTKSDLLLRSRGATPSRGALELA